jgi:bifunctional enzyme CysN/CysC/sulfate adenylyltransferase subunit 1
MLVGLETLPGMSSELHAKLCWMHPKALRSGKKLILKQTSRSTQAMVSSIESRLNIQTFEAEPAPAELGMNDIGEVKLRTANPLVFDGYASNRITGSLILIEPGTNATVAAGMLMPPGESVKPEYTDFAI